MIDYKKLRIANELCKKSGYSFSYFFGGKDINKNFGYENIADNCILYDLDSGPIIDDFDNLDGLLIKLMSLAFIPPKYKIGQEVWRLNDEYVPFSFVISDIDESSDEKYLEDSEGSWWIEELLYPSRKELIETQIEYWRNLQLKEQLTLSDRGSEINMPITACQPKDELCSL